MKMCPNGMNFGLRVFAVLCVQVSISSLTYAGDLEWKDLVDRHLNSIGTATARAAVKSRLVQGKLVLKILVGGGGTVEGTWGRVSQQRKVNFVMRFGIGDYRGEQFVFDGDKTYIAAESSQRRSRFGDFVLSQDYVLREGLLGGAFSTAWALQNLDENRPELIYAGLKKIDGRQLHDLEYHSRKSTDMRIHLYFDPETYHHVKTVYSMTFSPSVGPSITTSVNQQNVRYTIEERFTDFTTVNGMTLPSNYSIEYTEELQNGRTIVYHWDMTVDRTSDNVALDPRNFDTK